MNRLTTEKRVQIISALVEGNAINATARMVGVSKVTILKLLKDVGEACMAFENKALRNLPCKNIQCDEIWSFCYAKEKNVPEKYRGKFGYGDVWTWTAICADTKLIASWTLGNRGAETANAFMLDLASRLKNRIQLTTDGHRAYLQAVDNAFGCEVDYAMLVKIYGNDPQPDTRYSPAECIGCQMVEISGRPERKNISTSYVERQNLTMRMQMRRFTRLTNAHSKKIENQAYALALHFVHYNFARVHQTLRVTPAMEAGIADHVWTIEEIVRLSN
ncbi:MAG TPA: IS1 family transposase [Candidatus Acidoferrum sp.]|nr:IS1 family transposase [Candidatus Acidoferrum sp.]